MELGQLRASTHFYIENNFERPVDALAVKKGESLTDSVTDNLKSRDASASKKSILPILPIPYRQAHRL